MFRLNRLTDYGIGFRSLAAPDDGQVFTAGRWVKRSGVPVPTAKLLRMLSAAGVVNCHRGTGGRYSLDRPAVAVSVAEIVQSLKGPIALTACVDGAKDGCESETYCPLSGNWTRVNNAIRAVLECARLAVMTDPKDLFLVAAQSAAPVRGQHHGS